MHSKAQCPAETPRETFWCKDLFDWFCPPLKANHTVTTDWTWSAWRLVFLVQLSTSHPSDTFSPAEGSSCQRLERLGCAVISEAGRLKNRRKQKQGRRQAGGGEEAQSASHPITPPSARISGGVWFSSQCSPQPSAFWRVCLTPNGWFGRFWVINLASSHQHA